MAESCWPERWRSGADGGRRERTGEEQRKPGKPLRSCPKMKRKISKSTSVGAESLVPKSNFVEVSTRS